MQVRGRRFVHLAVVALLLLAVSEADPTQPTPGSPAPAPGSPSTAQTPAADGAVRIALIEPAAIDPAFAVDEPGLTVVDALFDPLTEVEPDGTVTGATAADWEVSEDGRTFTFRLRETARFHDGTQVRARDFVRAFNRLVRGTDDRAPAAPELLTEVQGFAATHLAGAPLAGVEEVDERNLRIRLDEPRADLPAVLSHPRFTPVPPLADLDPQEFARGPVGNGPYRLAAPWDGGAEIRLVGHEAHRQPPAVEHITFVLYVGQRAEERAYADLRAGSVDVAPVEPDAPLLSTLPPPRETTTVAADDRPLQILSGDVAEVYLYGFVTDRPPLDDPAVRRAFSLLVDRRVIASQAAGGRIPATSLLPPGTPGRQPATCGHCGFDPEAAAEVLAGRPLPPLRLLATDDDAATAAAHRVAADVTAATGLQVEVTTVPVSEYLDRLDAGDVDVFGLQWSLPTPTPDDLLFRAFSSRRVGATNLVRLRSAAIDALLEDARGARDRGRRLDLYRRVERRVLDQVVVTPVWYDRVAYGTSTTVQGLRIDRAGRLDLSGLRVER